ncbi:ArsR/SmtB family transcription factor [Desulfolutivibrio sp.]|uniref:ArsR/SmtB family transcription factor n=1 Tax=Desulfolutivibrio sp. TaxID=2773296 RepID=UPI002F965342
MNDIAKRLKALSDPTRLRIVQLLGHGELCVCDVMAALTLPQSRVSRHLAYLDNSGWVTGVRRGKWVSYRLAEPADPVQARVLAALRETLPGLPMAREDHARLCAHLKTKTAAACAGPDTAKQGDGI